MEKQERLETELLAKARVKAESLRQDVASGKLQKNVAKDLYDSYRDGQFDAIKIMHGPGPNKPVTGSDDENYRLIGLQQDPLNGTWK